MGEKGSDPISPHRAFDSGGLPIGAGQGALVEAAVEAELARLLVQSGITPSLQSDSAVPSVRVDAIQLTAQSTPAQMGRQITHSVYAGMGKTR
jgi:hypothetical protein